jgi:hypothetical protein
MSTTISASAGEASRAVKLYGTDMVDAPSRRLSAGQLSVGDGDPRDLAFDYCLEPLTR